MNSNPLKNKSADELMDLLDSEELPEIVEEPEEVPVEPFLKFIADFKLLPGDDLVRTELLYKLYKKSSRERITSAAFKNKLRQHFKVIRAFVYLNRNTIDVGYELGRLKIPKKKNKPKAQYVDAHFRAFMTSINLKPGHYHIGLHALHFIYDDWVYNQRRRGARIDYSDFQQLANIYLKTKEISPGEFVIGINKKELKYDLNPDKEAAANRRKERNYGKTKKENTQE